MTFCQYIRNRRRARLLEEMAKHPALWWRYKHGVPPISTIRPASFWRWWFRKP
jgi:hypothetical protein